MGGLKAESAKLKRQRKKAFIKCDQVKNKLATVEAERDEVQNKLATVNLGLDKLKNNNDKLKNNNDKLKNIYDTVALGLYEVKNELATVTLGLNHLMNKVATIQAERDHLKNKLATIEAERNILREGDFGSIGSASTCFVKENVTRITQSNYATFANKSSSPIARRRNPKRKARA